MRLLSIYDAFRLACVPRRGLVDAISIREEAQGYSGPVERPLPREADRAPAVMFSDFLPRV